MDDMDKSVDFYTKF
nr:hypothetical protein [uncultured Methanobrevibacter sp.]